MEDRNCGVCQNAYPSRQLCDCGQVVCTKCAQHITEQAVNPRCPHCHRALLFEQSQAQKDAKHYDRSELAKYRVIQRNLVYLIGLSPSIAEENIMSQEKYFGQYGRIKKCAVNKASPYASPLGISYSAYITYYSEVEATLCIKACDGFKIDGRRFKATFGTSKYCNSFIKGQRCLNSDCLYLHEEGSQVDTFTREDIQHNRHIQPHNSIFPLLNVTIIKPDLLHVLPIAKIQRRRVYSEDNSSPRPKPRLYSLDISGRRELSRFGFDEDSSEEPAEVPPFIQKILARNSPSKDIAQFFASEMPELLSHKWLKDLLEIKIPEIYADSLQNDDMIIASPRAV